MKTVQPQLAEHMCALSTGCFEGSRALTEILREVPIEDEGIIDAVRLLRDQLDSAAVRIHATLATLIQWAQRHPTASNLHARAPGSDSPKPVDTTRRPH